MKKHLFLIILTLAVLSVSNVWAGDTYIFPVTSASTCSGGTLGTDANGMWYYEMSDASDYVEIQFAVTELQTYLVKVGYTTSVTGATCNLQYYREGGEVGNYEFGMGHGASVSDVITEVNCGAQLTSDKLHPYDQFKPPYAVRVHPAQDKTMRVYYLKLEGETTGSQTTETIPSSLDLVFTSTANYNMISNSDFLYTRKEGEQVKAYDKEGTRRITFKNGIVAASRKLYTFETGTYKFTFHAYSDETHSDYKAPYVFVNNIVAGTSDFTINKDVAKSHDVEIEIDVTEGTYPVEFFFPNSYDEKLFYTTVSVEKKAVSCPGYTFHYGTNEQSDWTIACFENGAETDERVIENFTIPTVPDFYVGWQGNPLANNMTVRQAWNTDVEDSGNGVMNGAMVLLPVRGTSKVGWARGAVGTLRCWYGSTSKNQYVGFQPNGYAIMYGGNNYAFEETGTANKLETDVVTLPAVSTTYQMGIATADSYVTCAHSNPAEAISNMGVTNVAGGKKAIYLVPGSFDSAGAKYAVYDVTNATFDTDFMTDNDGDGIYVGYVGSNCSSMVLCRMNSDATTSDLSSKNWDKRWNQTANIGISGDLAKKYTITNMTTWNECAYTTANMQPITGQKGKFRMWANSADQNWYVHFIPYYVLSYDANGGSGATAQTERNSESSTLTVSVASNGFTAPTGHEFAGWNTVAEGGGDSYAAGASYTLTANGTLYAQWSPLSYTVTLNTNGGTINAGNVTSYTYGTGATLPTDVTKTGYDFGGWYDNSGLTGDCVYSIANNVTGNKEYWAKWTAKTTTITIDANTANHGSSTPGTVTATWGQALPVFTAASGASGWSLEGYYTGANDGTKIINDDGTLVASTTYTTADSKWNSESGSVTLYAQYELALSYCDFAIGHENNANYGNTDARVLVSIEPTGNANEYTLTVKPNTANGNTSKLDYLYVIASGNSPYPAEAGTDEGGVSYDELSVTFSNSNASANFTIQWSTPGWDGRWQCTPEVIFSKIVACDHNVIYSAPSNGSYTIQVGDGVASGANKTAATGETITLEANPSSGYTFGGWTITKTSDGTDVTASIGLSGTSTATFTMPAYDVTVAATFEEITCWSSRTYQVEDIMITTAGAVTDHDTQATPSNVMIITSENQNYDSNTDDYFASISDGAFVYNTQAGSAVYMEVDVPRAGNYTLDVYSGKGYEKNVWVNVYTTTYCSSCDHISYGGTTYYKQYNTQLNKDYSTYAIKLSDKNGETGVDNKAYPAGKCIIGIYTGSANCALDKIVLTRVDDSEVFCKHTITVNNTSGASSSAIADKSKALSGETVTVTAYDASAGYAFTGWTVTSGSATFDDASALSTTFVMPDADVTVQANYASSGYVVNYQVEGGNGTITSVKDGSGNDISNGEAVASGTVLTFTASPSSGYAVLGWYTWLNSTETLQGNTQNNNTFTYTVTQDITIRVKFETPYTLTLTSSPAAASATVSGGGSYVQGTVVSVSTSNENGDYTFVHWMDGEREESTSAASNYVMPASNKTLTAVWRLSRISSLSWAGREDLGSGIEVASSCFSGGCFDTQVTFTFSGSGTVNYYANNDRKTSLGTVYSGTAITLTDALRTHGIYIECTSGDANLTAVSKTTIGSVYQIWSGNVAVGSWSEQVVLGPEHFQTAMVGDVLRVNTSGEGGDAQGALQYILTDGDSHTYKGLDNSTTSGGLYYWDLTSGEKDQHYFEITIDATRLANLKRYGVIVKGRYYTIQSVELRASCSNQTMRTSAPDVTTYGEDGSIDIMTDKLELEGEGFNLGNWEHKLELDERCFNNVTVGSIINFYMKVEDGATLSFRCNVDSVHAKSYDDPPLCPSYGDISFDRTIDDLYGAAPTLIGRIKGYKVLYLLVDADMLRRLKETGMILCGKGTLIKVVEGVPETVVVNPEEEKKVPTVVNNLTIYQGGEVTNDEDIEVLGKITYIRHAKGGALSNKLDQWYTFALPFTVSDVEVLDTDGKWYDINAVYYSSDVTDQATNDPDGAGHYYLQYLKAENETAIGRAFAARWQYITPGHSERIYAYGEDRYGYPKKDSAYIILFDSNQPSELSGYWESNPTIRFVGVGPQTIDGVAKKWKVEADGEQYWMYANNTLHSFTLTDAYILNDAGTEFVLQESPTIRPFECYVQATASLKKKYAAIPMRGFRIDNTTTGAESIQGSAIRAEKILRNGQLIIIRNGVAYDATGVVIR